MCSCGWEGCCILSIIRKSIGNSIKFNPSHLWKHGLPTPEVMSIICSFQLKKTENWHGDNLRRAIKLDKELLYENRLRNSLFGKTKSLKEYSKGFGQQEYRVYLQHFRKSSLIGVIEKNFSVIISISCLFSQEKLQVTKISNFKRVLH